MSRESWLQERQTPKCIKFLKSILPERTLISLPDYEYIKDISKDQLYDTLIKADPHQGVNCIWLFIQFKKGQFLLEDIEHVHDDLNLFFINNTKIDRKFRKLGSIDYRKLKELIQPFKPDNKIDFVFIPNEDYIVLYDGPYGRLYRVLTQEGSCSLGSGTKWCTSAKNDNMFDDFIQYGPLFIWYDNEIKKKYQFHFETNSYRDERNNDIDQNLLTYFVLYHPVLKKFFLTKLIESAEYKKRLFLPSIKLRWLQAESYIMQNPIYAYQYTKNILKLRWPNAETYITQDRQHGLNILDSRWPEAEPYIILDPEYAYLYARDILKSRWPEAEPYIMEDPQYAYLYARDILNLT